MTDQDVMVAKPPQDDEEGRPERSLAEQLVEQARADGVDLVGPGGLLAGLTKQVLEAGLEVEMDEHLGYAKHAVEGRNGGNSRNGTRSKTVLTEIGPVEIEVPRDRDSSFDPQTVRKHQRRLDGVDSMVISLTAKGLTTGEVEAHLAEVYSTTISRETISKITDRVLGELAEWQTRPLDRVYPVIFIDAIVVKIRDGQVANRPVYTAIGVTVDGQRDILGLWVGTGGEGAKYWLQVLTEIKNRGVEDVCIVVCDGLKGLPESIGATWPLAVVQTCVLHLIRNTFRLAGRATGTAWPATCDPSTPPSTKPTPRPASMSSTRSGATATRRSARCGPTPGPSSCRSSTTPPRSAGSSTARTPSSRSTPGSAERPEPEGTSPTSRRRSSASTSSSDHSTRTAAARNAG